MITDHKFREAAFGDDVENIIEGPSEGKVAYELRLKQNPNSVLMPNFNNKSEMRAPAIIFSDNEIRKSIATSAAKTSNRFHL